MYYGDQNGQNPYNSSYVYPAEGSVGIYQNGYIPNQSSVKNYSQMEHPNQINCISGAGNEGQNWASTGAQGRRDNLRTIESDKLQNAGKITVQNVQKGYKNSQPGTYKHVNNQSDKTGQPKKAFSSEKKPKYTATAGSNVASNYGAQTAGPSTAEPQPIKPVIPRAKRAKGDKPANKNERKYRNVRKN